MQGIPNCTKDFNKVFLFADNANSILYWQCISNVKYSTQILWQNQYFVRPRKAKKTCMEHKFNIIWNEPQKISFITN